jgi:hypothetical protein
MGDEENEDRYGKDDADGSHDNENSPLAGNK